MRVEDKIALVTGSASGIGKKIAIIHAREGAKVVIADLDLKAAKATAAEIDPTGAISMALAMDMADEARVDAGIAEVVGAFCRLDVLVNKEGAEHGARANIICPGFVRTPLIETQIPVQARDLGITEREVIDDVMLKDTVDHKFTTVEDVAEAAVFFASFGSNALTGQSIIVSHGWFLE